jgi:hypothetical protein
MAIPKKTSRKEQKKPGTKSKKSRSRNIPTIPISREELFQLHDIADVLKLLRDIVAEAPEMQLIQVEILIQKTSRCAWNLIHEELDNRWQERNPDVDLIRKN